MNLITSRSKDQMSAEEDPDSTDAGISANKTQEEDTRIFNMRVYEKDILKYNSEYIKQKQEHERYYNTLQEVYLVVSRIMY
jgi:hypothetical protein